MTARAQGSVDRVRSRPRGEAPGSPLAVFIVVAAAMLLFAGIVHHHARQMTARLEVQALEVTTRIESLLAENATGTITGSSEAGSVTVGADLVLVPATHQLEWIVTGNDLQWCVTAWASGDTFRDRDHPVRYSSRADSFVPDGATCEAR